MNEQLERLNSVRNRIRQACLDAGRPVESVSLLAVSKRHPVERIIGLYRLGMSTFGENQLQEALDKQKELEAFDIEWHFIGTIQSNKTHSIAEHFQWVQSVDRVKILRRLSAQRPAHLPALNICLQVNIDRESQKSGALPEEIPALAELAGNLDRIRLRGLMVLPRLTEIREEQESSFRKVKDLFEKLRNDGHDMDTLSMGMSHDLEAAVAQGSTMVRVGTDLFGERPT